MEKPRFLLQKQPLGFFDRNGREFCEGDIYIQYTDKGIELGSYNKEGVFQRKEHIVRVVARFNTIQIYVDVAETQLSQYLLALPDGCEIIGSIYDSQDYEPTDVSNQIQTVNQGTAG